MGNFLSYGNWFGGLKQKKKIHMEAEKIRIKSNIVLVSKE